MDITTISTAIVQSAEATSAGGQDGSWQLLTIYAAIALGLSFLCSIAEAVLLSVTPSHVAYMEQQNCKSGRIMGRLKRNIDRPLSAILTLNTVAHTAGAAGVGAQASAIFGSKSVGITSAILTFLILVLSEIIPKTLGSVYWRKLAPITACGVYTLTVVLYPVVLFCEQITKIFAGGGQTKAFTREEFSALASLGAQEGHLSQKEYRILGNLLRFRSYKVHDIMTPRTVVFALHEDTTVNEVFDKYSSIPFSRIPLYRSSRDEITGFVLKNDIMLNKAEGKGSNPLKDFCRNLKAIPETSSLFDTFEFLLDNREHILLVVDEYGGMEGIVTTEDVVETLLGLEIVDEADVTVDMQSLARSRWERHAQRLGIEKDFSEKSSE